MPLNVDRISTGSLSVNGTEITNGTVQKVIITKVLTGDTQTVVTHNMNLVNPYVIVNFVVTDPIVYHSGINYDITNYTSNSFEVIMYTQGSVETYDIIIIG